MSAQGAGKIPGRRESCFNLHSTDTMIDIPLSCLEINSEVMIPVALPPCPSFLFLLFLVVVVVECGLVPT